MRVAEPEARTLRPNILLCMTDDQGWGDVSYNGLKKNRTPNLDAMAAVVNRMKAELEIWQQSVIRSSNGGDYRSK